MSAFFLSLWGRLFGRPVSSLKADVAALGGPLLEREIDGHTNIKNENPLPNLLNYILSCSCAMVLFLGSRAGKLALVVTLAVVIIITVSSILRIFRGKSILVL
jgi:hypothetical protein